MTIEKTRSSIVTIASFLPWRTINVAIRHTNRVIRLHNDLGMLDKEIQESGVNFFMITYYKMLTNQKITIKRGLVKAGRYVLQLAGFFGQEYYGMLKQIQTKSGQIEELVFRVLAFHSCFYDHSKHDYHTTSLTNTQTLFDIGSA